ncbi:hypothetical protein [Legionella impletisoli]|uniref:Diaminopimelate epimerase n=1 Tax=Legionella impletisoli TaxID=343510 RepID=A0A917NAE4_9GAMM|nr:hypothetical protein [Legionella impletisoli]GGI82417.1 diaminopimelate epimerase [Legionella impletisoli]
MKEYPNIQLAEGCQNTFILVDCLKEKTLDDASLETIHQILVREERDDAMILLDGVAKDDTYFFIMWVLGRDKAMGDFCGNGSRACAAYMYSHYPMFEQFVIRTPKADRPLHRYDDQTYSIQLPKVNFKPDNKFFSHKTQFHRNKGFYCYDFAGFRFYYTDAIEPHFILPQELSSEALLALGQQLNHLTDEFPLGMNITSYREIEKNYLKAQTYERGVQRPTQSCGTGATCAAAFYLEDKVGEVKIKNPGGILTLVNHPDSIELIGPALLTGVISWPNE